MAIVDEKYSPIYINVIIASKNITDPITIEALRSVVLMKNKEMQSGGAL
jgi:peptidoglycan hydrolase CwlO-like protein